MCAASVLKGNTLLAKFAVQFYESVSWCCHPPCHQTLRIDREGVIAPINNAKKYNVFWLKFCSKSWNFLF